ncbi:MAG: hypothetical protein WA915_14910 [Candidatus Aminicenantaceae bacterium]
MAEDYSVQTIRDLEDLFYQQKIFRPIRLRRYEQGTELFYDIKGVVPAKLGRVKLVVEEFIGGGYAGQVYRVKVLDTESSERGIEGIQPGETYAMKILIPLSGFARMFRNMIYALAFQGPFSLQVNPSAARAGAIWQKFLRRGTKIRFGSERAVVDIHATFIDSALGSCGELSEWIDGRMWRFEVDDDLDARFHWKVGDPEDNIGSPEYRAKKTFMARFVELMHEMGAAELARQYEWATCKSQPNALKRLESDASPYEGHVAVDFRAGLALLPFLPMCPADFKLILKGIARGSWVQFDRGNLAKLESFVNRNPETFEDMGEALEELKENERDYRDSLPDITHHHFRLLFSPKLWSSILKGSITSWRVRNHIDDEHFNRLIKTRLLALVFYLLGFIPFLGKFIRKIWGDEEYRKHYGRLFSSFSYFLRVGRARIAETLIRWHRAGRVDDKRAQQLSRSPIRFYAHLPLSILPAKVHRFFSDRRFFLQSLDNIFARPLRLYFRAEVREKWLRDTVAQGKETGMLTEEEAAHITSQLKEPFIQKYLKSLAVHVCTAPVTQIVSVLVAIIYVRMHPELSWQEAMVHAGLILGLFQVIPISPGSLARGFYVTFLVLRERNFKDYNIAFLLSFFKYIGYLAFPIQMAYRYPDLARFMAGHWATSAVHIVPVFGERGALLEHAVFDLFYNYPLTIQRRIQKRREIRARLKPRYWHVLLCALAGSALLTLKDWGYFQWKGHIPTFGESWWLVISVPVFTAILVSVWAGGALLSRRILIGGLSGALTGFFYAIFNSAFSIVFSPEAERLAFHQILGQTATSALWKMFLFTLLAISAVFIFEARPLRKTT